MLKTKSIAFLATGNEIIYGDVQDTNCHDFAKLLDEKGATIFQHIKASDAKAEISAALHYLLQHSDAIILTGGLGPTSDDVTRFALAKTLNLELSLHETAWQHIAARLAKINLPETPFHRQQALFPKDAELYPNPCGTAFGCHLAWQDKHVFMLPGPPKECQPMLHQYVLSELEKHSFFSQRITYRWLTLGLIEGVIAAEIDRYANSFPVSTAYCWRYPYLEVKLITETSADIAPLLKQIDTCLQAYTVSRTRLTALEVLLTLLTKFTGEIYLLDLVTEGHLARELIHPKLKWLKKQEHAAEIVLQFEVTPALSSYQGEELGTIRLLCMGKKGNKECYRHHMDFTYRGGVEQAVAYVVWQTAQFIQSLLNSEKTNCNSL